MACTLTRLELSNTDATTVDVTLTTDPGDGTAVVLEVPGLSINASQDTSGAAVSYSIATQTASTNSLWDGTIQIGANAPAEIVVQIVETSAAQTVGLTVTDADVSYCAPLGAASTYDDLTSGTVQIDLLPSGDQTLDLGSADYRWAEIHGNLDGPVTFRAKASTGTLAVGDVVYIDGVSGETPTVAKASAASSSTMPAFGVISQGGTAPAEVYITTFGSLSGVALPAATYTIGQNVYVSTTAGEFTNTAPTGESNLIQNIGFVAKTHDTNGILKVGGAGRSNAVPNLNQDKIFLGNASNQAVPTALSSINLSKFNDDLPAVQDSYLMLIESPTDKTYIIDGRVAAGRTVTNFYAKTSSGTCTATLKNVTDTTTIGTISVTSTGGSAASLTNTSVTENERLSIEISSNSSAADLELVVEYTQ